MSKNVKKALILSVGYGAGHHAAAGAVAEALEKRGWFVRVEDPCLLAHPHLFQLTRQFYQFCVRTAPWLWSVTYDQTNTADWSRRVFSPILKSVTEIVEGVIESERPNVVICTYPLYAHMIDALQETKGITIPYAVVVTDALEISRPWLANKSPLVFFSDEHSCERMVQRYALSPHRLVVSGFPVREAFKRPPIRVIPPTEETLNIVYGAYAPLDRVRNDLDALMVAYPKARITVIAGERLKLLQAYTKVGVSVIDSTRNMESLFSEAHLYIGKAGAATIFESYASCLPVLINYALPGQEQGNLELLLRDGVGCMCPSSTTLVETIQRLLRYGAAEWQKMSSTMQRLRRADGAQQIADTLETYLMYE